MGVFDVFYVQVVIGIGGDDDVVLGIGVDYDGGDVGGFVCDFVNVMVIDVVGGD